MKEISEGQRSLLEQFRRQGHSIDRGINLIYHFVRQKSEDEPLDPAWTTIWDKHKKYARTRLPRSLFKSIDETLARIELIDKEVFGIRINENTRITFLLGAGASTPSGIPAVDKLLSELWKRARKIGREDLDRLAKWCNERGITNIEDLLTAAYISNFAAKNRNITSLLDYFIFSGGREVSEEEEEEEEYLPSRHRPSITSEIDVSSISSLQDTLQTLFALLTSTMISAVPNHANEAIVDFVKEHKETTIITTNYDGCMDEALLRTGMGLKGTIASHNEHRDNSDAVELIKMHGSINWAYCDSCHDAREFDLLELKKLYEEDKISYPVMGICKNCGGLRRPLLVPPLSFKFLMFPDLVNIWNSARQSIEGADYLVVVGYSFSEADAYIMKVISRSMFITKNQKMIIINTNKNLVPVLRERFSAHLDGFDDRRILQVCKNCEEILPNILKSIRGKARKNKKTKSTPKKSTR